MDRTRIRAASQNPHDAGAATLEFRIDGMTGESINVRRVAAEGPASRSAVRTRTTKMGATARAAKFQKSGDAPIRFSVSCLLRESEDEYKVAACVSHEYQEDAMHAHGLL